MTLKSIDPNLAATDIHTMGDLIFDRDRATAVSDLAADRVCRDCVDDGACGIVGVDEVLSESAHARGGYTSISHAYWLVASD